MRGLLCLFSSSFFALLLIGYEMRTQMVDLKLRDSFGFMYNPWGRCLFLSMCVPGSSLVMVTAC